MGKPRLIILVRHAQSEGNKNREIHQLIPDHRVKLTEEGHRQAESAGRRLRAMLRPDDTIQFFTSPYRRTRETTEGILKTLTARHDPEDPDAAPSPFSRSKIKVYEEPRLREQDFGNFQPCSAEMERMWRERADYGHFFYRIPNGESAADAYDRISGFNESLWRQFGEQDFPSVCVLVTHGLMTRVFLMKWYHWSVEYFEDLRNINHCEFILMKQNLDNGKFILQNQLRTWSELKRQKAEQAKTQESVPDPIRRNTLSSFLKDAVPVRSPNIPPQKWGGCIGGCDHKNEQYPRRVQLAEQANAGPIELPPSATAEAKAKTISVPITPEHKSPAKVKSDPNSSDDPVIQGDTLPQDSNAKKGIAERVKAEMMQQEESSGRATPHEMSDEDEYFPSNTADEPDEQLRPSVRPRSIAIAMRRPQRKATPEDIQRWADESGMGRGKKADALGDEPNAEDDDVDDPDVVDYHERTETDEGIPLALARAERQDKSLRGSVY